MIFESEARFIARETQKYPHSETGGDLFGYWTHSGALVVMCALGPGPKARRNEVSFFQDLDYLKREGVRLIDAFGAQHIGEWHSHHQMDLDHPSQGDVNSVVNGLEAHPIPRFGLVICNLNFSRRATTSHRVTLNGFLFARHSDRYRRCDWVLLPGLSPLRRNAPAEGWGDEPEDGDYEFRPAPFGMADLREPGEPSDPARAGDTWLSRDENRLRLEEELRALSAMDVAPRVFLMKDKAVKIVIRLGQGEIGYYLPADYPRSRPLIGLQTRPGAPPLPIEMEAAYEPTMSLADLHRQLLSDPRVRSLTDLSS
jgi:hypothetical protein